MFGTNREKSFYKITAVVGGKEYIFDSPDWNYVSNSVWRLIIKKDHPIDTNKVPFTEHSSIVYKIDRYDFGSCCLEEGYAFAVQPLF